MTKHKIHPYLRKINRTVKWYMRSGPQTLSVFTTNRCNYSCCYCNRNVKSDSPTIENKYIGNCDFKYPDLKDILDKYPSIRNVSFVGIGEPFLTPDLIPMAKLAKQYKKATSVITNGSLLHHYWGKIAESFDSISISIHGTDAVDLSTIANVDASIFSQVVHNINYLIFTESKLNPTLRIRASVVIIKSQLDRIANAAQFCVQNAIPTLDLQNYLPSDIRDGGKCLFSDEFKYIKCIDDLIETYKDSLKINRPVLIKRNPKLMLNSCDSFFSTLRVDGFGHISGCPRILIPSAVNGNFKVEKDVWNNAYFKKAREKTINNEYMSECCRYCPNAQ